MPAHSCYVSVARGDCSSWAFKQRILNARPRASLLRLGLTVHLASSCCVNYLLVTAVNPLMEWQWTEMWMIFTWKHRRGFGIIQQVIGKGCEKLFVYSVTSFQWAVSSSYLVFWVWLSNAVPPSDWEQSRLRFGATSGAWQTDGGVIWRFSLCLRRVE